MSGNSWSGLIEINVFQSQLSEYKKLFIYIITINNFIWY